MDYEPCQDLNAAPPPPRTTWIAFCGGSWLWDGKDGKIDDSSLGDMVGPFATWTAAATWALDKFPLEGTVAEQRETLTGLVRRVDPPNSWTGQIELTPANLTEAISAVAEVLDQIGPEMNAAQAALDAEMDLFWSARSGVS